MKKNFYLFIFLLGIVLLPKTVFASTINDALTDGKFVIPSVPFTGDIAYDTFAVYIYEDLELQDVYIEYGSCNDTFTQCTIKDNTESRVVAVEWKYDAKIKKIVDEIASNYPKNVTEYIVDDYAVINMMINHGSIVSNCLEFKKNIGYKNFYIDQRGGGGVPYTDSVIGLLKFKVDGTLYWRGEKDPRFESREILYVSEDATDIESALEERLKTLFPSHTFEVTKSTDPDDTITKILQDYIDESTQMYNDNTAYFVSEGYETLDSYLASKHDYDWLNGAEEYLYDVTIDDGMGSLFIVKKDSSKAVNKVDYVTNDVLTSVSIKVLGNQLLPFDTNIQVNKITEGADYEKILNTLNLKSNDSETYDIKLYSKANNEYFTKLTDGKFEVSIPIPENLKDKKTLVIYYVSEDGKTTETFEVTPKNGYAVFVTSHFSTYTLASTDTEETTTDTTNATTTKEKDINNPGTLDNINLYVILLIISSLGILFSLKNRKTN